MKLMNHYLVDNVIFTTTKFSLYFLMFTVLYSILIGCNSSFCLIWLFLEYEVTTLEPEILAGT